MNRYQVINLQTSERICGFLSNASDLDGLLGCVYGYSKNKLPWQWALQQEIYGNWETIIYEKSSPAYERYLKNINKFKEFFGWYLSFDEYEQQTQILDEQSAG